MVKLKHIDKREDVLEHIVNKRFAPGILLYELLKSGSNLIPTDEDGHASEYKPKDKGAEERAIFELATSVNGFAFRSSACNISFKPCFFYS